MGVGHRAVVGGMDESSPTQNRRSSRSKVMLRAELAWGESCLPVNLRDLSVEGALVEGARLPPAGSQGLLKRNGVEVECRVVWKNGAQAGLAFAEAVQSGQIMRTIRPPGPKPAVDYRRPGVRTHELSPTEQALIKIMAKSVSDLNR